MTGLLCKRDPYRSLEDSAMKRLIAMFLLLASCSVEPMAPKPYTVLSERRGINHVLVKVGVPTGATIEQIRTWNAEIVKTEGRGDTIMINYFAGPADADHMVASYANGTLQNTRDN